MQIDLSRLVTAADKAARIEEAARAEARAFLAETDWLVLRAVEGGAPVPDDIAAARAAAREVASN